MDLLRESRSEGISQYRILRFARREQEQEDPSQRRRKCHRDFPSSHGELVRILSRIIDN
jgi:hypothetical protein